MNSFCQYDFFGSFQSSDRSDMFYEVGLLKNLGKLTGKHLCRSFFFFIMLLTVKPATLLKKEFSADVLLSTLHSCSPLLKAPCRTPPVSAFNLSAIFLTLRPRKTYIYVFQKFLLFHIANPLHVPYRS